MKEKNRANLTMEERLKLAARSQASSPEAAAKLVERLSKVPTVTLLAGSGDGSLMCSMLGEYWERLEGDLLHYSGFCRSFWIAVEDDYEPPAGSAPIRPIWGPRVVNAIVLLGLILLDHAKGRREDKAIYHCTRMTLGQYLDAVEALAFPEEDAPPTKRFRSWRDRFLQGYVYDRSVPLADVLANILRIYIDGWKEFDHLHHILRCTGALACYLEDVAGEPLPQEEAERVRQFREMLLHQYGPGLEGWELLEADKRYLDPGGYFLRLANEYPDNLPDPGWKDTPAQAVRSQIFLPGWAHEPGALQALADLAPSPDLGALLKKYGDPKRLTTAKTKIDIAALDLHMLWIEPYLWMEERRGKESPETEAPLG